MADVNNPESFSEALQTTPPTVAENGVVSHLHEPPPPLLPTLPAPNRTVHLKNWGLQLALALGVAILLVVLIRTQFGYSLRSALVAGAIGGGALGFMTHGLFHRGTAKKTGVVEEPAPPTDGVREIIETIVFVVVLVLLLKSFAAEAFVIPTGSMAETLYGYQRVVACPECGLDFPVNCSSEVDPSNNAPPTEITGCTCPSCRYHIDFKTEERLHPGWHKPNWNSGDRVLVAKFLYELFNKRPDRLDVVVFKYPGGSHGGGDIFPRSGPMTHHTPMNYIKRLVGLPGETIVVHRGRLYRLQYELGQFDSDSEFPDFAQSQHDEEARIKLWQYEHMHVNDAQALRRFREEHFEILRKSPETMLAMRRLVYDNDHQAKDLKTDQPEQPALPPRWAGETWKEDGTGFTIDSGNEATQWLRYRHYLRDNPRALTKFSQMQDALTGQAPARSLVTDVMGYNYYEPHGGGPPGENWAGDLLIECDATIDKTEGELVLELARGKDRFQMHWNLATGDMELLRLKGVPGDRQVEKLAAKKTALPKKGSTYRLRFSDFDDRLTVWLDGSLPFDDGVIYKGSKEQHAGPVKENDLEPASIGISKGAVTVRKLSLWRDTYYTAGDSPTSADANGAVDFCNPKTWDSLTDNMPIKTLYVQPNHFLCLGDNSSESSDGRSWGLVPERLLLGRAMLVYYPFNRAGRIR